MENPNQIEDLFLPPCSICESQRDRCRNPYTVRSSYTAICPAHKKQYIETLEEWHERYKTSFPFDTRHTATDFQQWARIHYPASSRVVWDLPLGRDLSKPLLSTGELLVKAALALKKAKSDGR